MDTILSLKIYNGEGVDDTLFPNADNPIEIGAFRYDAKRMGGAPTISASVNYPSCLDEEWTDNVYALFNGEKYFLKQTPTSSYDNTSTMYKHDLVLVSERVILDDVYFFDTVVGDPQGSDKPVSNSTKVVFFGNVREFADRLNASLEYSGIGYRVEVDQEVGSEEKLMSFEDQFLSNVLQEIYNTYEVPYYFDGKTIRIGYSKAGVVAPEFSYGVDNALLSITKNNANYKIVNRATATGSSDNIPFYYPNNSPKGEIAVDTTSTGATFTIVDGEAFSNEVGIGDVVVYGSGFARGMSLMVSDDGNKWTSYHGEALPITIANMKPVQKWFLYTFQVDTEGRVKIGGTVTIDSGDTRGFLEFLTFAEINNRHGKQRVSIEDGYIDCGRLDAGSHSLKIGYSFPYLGRVNYTIATTLGTAMASGWYNETQGKETSLAKMGLAYSGTLASGDTITQRLVRYVNTSQKLMPFKYRQTNGDDRFYNAISGAYDGWIFNNPFVEGRPKEHIFSVEDIKPSIEGMEYNEQRIDMFEDFAYDEGDNDETYEDEDGNVYFKHPYFFAKLKPLGFNLFDHAIEQQPMVISFTKGDCGACNFEIAVDEDTQKNTVQVDENGDLIYVDGRVLCGAEGSGQGEVQPQDIQQDTTNRSVWIALRKEEDTYGILMPQYGKHEPSTEDTFVILGINLPYEYIEYAEKKLEAEIIKYLKDNNDEKFTFSINFSRIYFAENEGVLENLNENSKITIWYNGHDYDLYVTSFSYTMSEGDALPEIRVELDDTLKVSQNALQNAINEVKSSIGNTVNEIAQEFAVQRRSYVSKVEDDNAQGVVNFTKGIKFGEGGKVEVLDNNSAKLTIEYLEVTKKASFTSLEIQEKTHVGGQILVTPAAINCGEVEEFEDFYRCYFQTKGADGDEIFNQFAVGDQAICQTYNAWGSVYYWRLVTGIGEDYIDLSKTECDEESGIPKAGDKIIQLGNQIDPSRQNAIVIAAYGDGSPYFIQYKGINEFSLSNDKVVTKLSPDGNLITGVLRIEQGTTGAENIADLPDFIKENVGDIETGESGSNLLRNSGFTGDYLSKGLTDQDVLDEVTKMENPPLVHWEATNVEVEENAESESSFGVKFSEGGVLSQELYYSLIPNESYVLSFKAKSDSGATLTYTVGDQVGDIVLDATAKRHKAKFIVTAKNKVFSLACNDCSLWEVQLERGTMASSWGASMLDNSSDRAYWQAQKYMTGAIEDASTTFAGGIGLTNMMMLGNYDKETKSMTEVTAGMSGNRVNDNDVAFWAGGDYEASVHTAIEYLVNHAKGEWQPTEEELMTMAKFVLTHGGTAILNDIILRGIVYATGGKFGDLTIGKYVNACGHSDTEDSVFSEATHIVGDTKYSTVVKMSSGSIRAAGSHYNDLYCYQGNILQIDADSDIAMNPKGSVLYVESNNMDAVRVFGRINHESGQYYGFKAPTKVVTSNYTVDTNKVSVVIGDTNVRSLYVYVPIPVGSTMDGSFVEIHNVGDGLITIDTNDDGYISYNGQDKTQFSLEPYKVARLIYSYEKRKWYMVIV
jgi:uncharacterized protein involved in tellurium resistance